MTVVTIFYVAESVVKIPSPSSRPSRIEKRERQFYRCNQSGSAESEAYSEKRYGTKNGGEAEWKREN